MIAHYIHPSYRSDEYEKYRLGYIGGKDFLERFLYKLSARESEADFEERKKLSYVSAFAKQGLKEIKNAITQRAGEISRQSVSQTYMKAIQGELGGVDLKGSTMNRFMMDNVTPELMQMGRVAVYVDNAQFDPVSTLAELDPTVHPYCYTYVQENILNWQYQFYGSERVYTSLFVQECYEDTNLDDWELPITKTETRYRHFKLLPDGTGVRVRVFKEVQEEGEEVTTLKLQQERILQLPRIPVVFFDIRESLLVDTVDIQIALTNLSSVDVAYIFKANFPFYVEPHDNRAASFSTKSQIDPTTGETVVGENNLRHEIGVGIATGRKYPHDADPPSFIHPSSEPLRASMDKQEKLEEQIRKLLHLAVANVSPSRASAESKRVDQVSLESGLSAIGLELEGGEREIARIWAMYEGNANAKCAVKYPTSYQIKSDGERLETANKYLEVANKIPSRDFARIMAKEVAEMLLKGRVDAETLGKVLTEIDTCKWLTRDATEIKSDLEAGLVSMETASDARGYDGPNEVPKAKEEHAARLARIAQAQTTGVGGVKDIADSPRTRLADMEMKTPEVRGEGK